MRVGLLDDRRWQVALIVLGVLGLSLGGYVVGHLRPATVHHERAGCLSAPGAISCDLSDGWTIGVPRDVSWTDVQGAWHDDGRPQCLPPTGRGLEGPVGLSWVEAEVDGVGWRQVVHVDCGG
ncbi:hypothetical protein GCM10009795_045090 [Nocardioides hankookensis]|uniref:Secreted protein n=1 Tax=Nocardioides hankookensis TaxID=443157 RepID=A0ABW1LRG3_9ACTN